MSDGKGVLVTGGAGYIGSHTVLALCETGRRVVVIDDLSTGDRSLVPDDVVFIEGDAGRIEMVRNVLRNEGCGAVVHFAGSIVNPESYEKPLEYYANNTGVSRDLLEACVAEGVETFLFSSTAAVYGEAKALPISETAPTQPLAPYGKSKLMTEWMLRDTAARYGFRWGALRYFNVAGADPGGRSGQVGPATHLIKIATEVAVGARNGMQIFGDDYDTPDGTCIRDYIHVSDLADAHVAVLDHLEGGADALIANCGYGHGFSVREVLDVAENVAGRSLNATVGPRRIGDAAALVADNAHLLENLSWRPRYDDLEFIVETALAWERKRRGAER